MSKGKNRQGKKSQRILLLSILLMPFLSACSAGYQVSLGTKKPPPLPTVAIEPLDIGTHPDIQHFVRFYQRDGRRFIEEAVSRRKPYERDLKRIFNQDNLPVDLLSVPIVESGFKRNARSPSGAVGIWQFTAPTARAQGLQVSAFRDERRDVIKSTDAAARYLLELYDQFGDWHLALAAYNSGPTRLSSSWRQ